MWHSTLKVQFNCNLKNKQPVILVKTHWKTRNTLYDHCSQPPQPQMTLKHSDSGSLTVSPWGVLIIVTWNKNHNILFSSTGCELLSTLQTYLNLDHFNCVSTCCRPNISRQARSPLPPCFWWLPPHVYPQPRPKSTADKTRLGILIRKWNMINDVGRL